MPKNIQTEAAFEALIQQNNTVVAVDFWAPWCGPCQAFGPILDQAAQAVGERAVLTKVNVDELPELARNYRITSIPSVLYFQNGTVVDRATGIEPTEKIVARLNTLNLQQV